MTGWYPCCEGVCINCTGNMPDEIEVTIAGVTNAVCSDCAAYWNDTFILAILGPPEDCSYRWIETVYAGCVTDFGTNDLYITINYRGVAEGAQIYITVSSAGGRDAIFKKQYTDPAKPDCEPAGPIAIPRISSVDTDCDFSSATCSIDAVP